MKIAIFEGRLVSVEENHVKDDVFVIDFNGLLQASFKRTGEKFICTNAVNGWGKNVKHIYEGKELILE